MKKRLANINHFAVISRLLLVALLLCLSAAPMTVQAETDSSVTDYLKKNKEQEESPAAKSEKPDEADLNNDVSPSPVGLTAWDYIKTLLALAFVIALLYGMVKFINTRNRVTQHGKLMQNMGGLSLGQHKSIQLVKIGEQYFLIGVGDDVRLLKELSNPEEIAQLADYYSEEDQVLQQTLLMRLVNGVKTRKTNPYQKQEEPEEFGNLFKTKLTEIENERKRQLNQLTEKERKRNE
ncbi:flagellar biosynthetic protein FliO [Sporosarcina gallistercoris]|uniref:Flagellar biosynthetic protein FliO n=1 Tax=Sporosarcina gallistercoris TaxID=2762245 RepID=A0ABR8PG99_9BACL|nr:flagellar biosynthetic protein FliO [Sporosarcina gallistercoris]MBD7907119.1 flagellar biosynthetic protein FliO [Sporosarcina gallistercoris]